MAEYRVLVVNVLAARTYWDPEHKRERLFTGGLPTSKLDGQLSFVVQPDGDENCTAVGGVFLSSIDAGFPNVISILADHQALPVVLKFFDLL